MSQALLSEANQRFLLLFLEKEEYRPGKQPFSRVLEEYAT
jgi:hypothetical protein